jgi:hypothetical protein
MKITPVNNVNSVASILLMTGGKNPVSTPNTPPATTANAIIAAMFPSSRLKFMP